jgi:hypothetical protein
MIFARRVEHALDVTIALLLSIGRPKLILHPPVVIGQPPQTGTKEVRTCLQ